MMGAYSAWFDEWLRHSTATAGSATATGAALNGTKLFLDARLRDWCSKRLPQLLLVCDYEPDESVICSALGGYPAFVALPGAPTQRWPNVSYLQLSTASNPLIWQMESAAVPVAPVGLATGSKVPFGKPVTVVLFWSSTPPVFGKTLLQLWRFGVQRVLLPNRVAGWQHSTLGPAPGWRVVHPFWQALRQLCLHLPQRWRQPQANDDADWSIRAANEWVRQVRLLHAVNYLSQNLPLKLQIQSKSVKKGAINANASATPVQESSLDRTKTQIERPLRIVHFVNSLNSGGAERQACYAALAQQRDGHQVRLLLRQAPVGEDGHYRFLLNNSAVNVHRIGAYWQSSFQDNWDRSPLAQPHQPGRELLRSLPGPLRTMVIDMLGELLADPVDVLHCYVDDCNTVGGLAGILAGVPAIVLSMRNGNPTHFPGLRRGWMESCYLAFRQIPTIVLQANSEAGARDYEQWLGLPTGQIGVVRNAFVAPPPPTVETLARLRQEWDLLPGTPTVVAAFRLQPEKRPVEFVRCVAQLRRLLPTVRVFHAGVGPLAHRCQQEMRRLGLTDCLTLLGQREDLPAWLALGHVLLLTSVWEGTPNIVLEAQHHGCVPCITRAGGSAETLVPGETGIVVEADEWERLATEAALLLVDAARRQRMATAGKAFVADAFSLARLHEQNLQSYYDLLQQSASRRVA